jgi:hypothetical protein
MVSEIKLNRGHVAIVDDDDHSRLSEYKWVAYAENRRSDGSVRVYARRHCGRMVYELMAHAVLRPRYGLFVDHINGNTLDNRKENLRLATHSQNMFNKRPRVNAASPYKGVESSDGTVRPWRARITFGGKRRHLGSFATEEEAALAYDHAARESFGEFAWLNFPDVKLENPPDPAGGFVRFRSMPEDQRELAVALSRSMSKTKLVELVFKLAEPVGFDLNELLEKP